MNIILIGMPGAGKSTVGVVLAKTLGMGFLDTDLNIQTATHRRLQDIIAQDGCDAFMALENQTIAGMWADNCVIATGGSVVYGADAMAQLCRLGKIVYLKLPIAELAARLDNISTRGVVMRPGESIEEIFRERVPLYEKYADITVDAAGMTLEQVVAQITEAGLTDD